MLRQPFAAGVVALVAGAALSLGVALLVREQWQDAVHARFERRTAHVTAMLRHELQTSVAVLEAARGALGVTPDMTPERWRRYVAALDLDNTPSPVRQLGYAPLSAAARGALDIGGTLPAEPLAVTALNAPASAAPVAGFGERDASALRRAM